MNRTHSTGILRVACSLTAGGFLIPPLTWAVYFLVSYSLTGVACTSALQGADLFGVSLIRFILVVITLLAIGIVLGTGIRAWRYIRLTPDTDEHTGDNRSLFLGYLSLLLSALFLIALIWIGIPTLVLDPCVVN